MTKEEFIEQIRNGVGDEEVILLTTSPNGNVTAASKKNPHKCVSLGWAGDAFAKPETIGDIVGEEHHAKVFGVIAANETILSGRLKTAITERRKELSNNELVTVKVTPEMRSRATLKNKKHMEFKVPQNIIEEGRKRHFNNPLFYESKEDACWCAIYTDRGELFIKLLHSWDSYKEERCYVCEQEKAGEKVVQLDDVQDRFICKEHQKKLQTLMGGGVKRK
jgi:hypothetical protein